MIQDTNETAITNILTEEGAANVLDVVVMYALRRSLDSGRISSGALENHWLEVAAMLQEAAMYMRTHC